MRTASQRVESHNPQQNDPACNKARTSHNGCYGTRAVVENWLASKPVAVSPPGMSMPKLWLQDAKAVLNTSIEMTVRNGAFPMVFKKEISCALLFTLIAQGVWAQDSDGMKLTSDNRFPLNEELCGLVVEQFARLTMLRRQTGASLSEVMSEAGESDALFGFNDTVKDMALAAYDSPRFNTKENRMDAVDDFANDWVLACYQAQR